MHQLPGGVAKDTFSGQSAVYLRFPMLCTHLPRVSTSRGVSPQMTRYQRILRLCRSYRNRSEPADPLIDIASPRQLSGNFQQLYCTRFGVLNDVGTADSCPLTGRLGYGLGLVVLKLGLAALVEPLNGSWMRNGDAIDPPLEE